MIGELLFSAGAIARRVDELAAQMRADYAGRVPVFLGVLTTALPFLADLVRAFAGECEIDVIALHRPREGPAIALDRLPQIPLAARDAIVVDGTIDTGMTLHYVLKMLQPLRPASLAVCALLDRPHRRLADVAIAYRGFTVPDVYAVGYGLGYRGRYRELPALYAHAAWPS